MPTINTKALILRTVNFGEHDRFLTLLTPANGLLEVLAKRAASPKGSLLRVTEPLSLIEAVIFVNRDRYYLNKASVEEGFTGLQTDLVCLTAASHLAEVWRAAAAHITAAGEGEAKLLYQLACYSLHALATQSEPAPLAMVRAAEFKSLQYAGFEVYLDRCAVCHTPLPDTGDGSILFSLAAAQPICSRASCRAELSQAPYAGRHFLTLLPDAVKALRFFAAAEPARLFHFRLSETVEKNLAALASPYLADRLERSFNKLTFLEKLF